MRACVCVECGLWDGVLGFEFSRPCLFAAENDHKVRWGVIAACVCTCIDRCLYGLVVCCVGIRVGRLVYAWMVWHP